MESRPTPQWADARLVEHEAFQHTIEVPSRNFVGDMYYTLRNHAELEGAPDDADDTRDTWRETVTQAIPVALMQSLAGLLIGLTLTGFAATRVFGDQLCTFVPFYDRPPARRLARVCINVVNHAVFTLSMIAMLRLMFGSRTVRGLWVGNVVAALTIGALNFVWSSDAVEWYADINLWKLEACVASLLLFVAAVNAWIVSRRVLGRHAELVAHRAARALSVPGTKLPFKFASATSVAGDSAAAAAETAATASTTRATSVVMPAPNASPGAAATATGSAGRPATTGAAAPARHKAPHTATSRRIRFSMVLTAPMFHMLLVGIVVSIVVVNVYSAPGTSDFTKRVIILAMPWWNTGVFVLADITTWRFRYSHPGTHFTATALLVASNAFVERLIQSQLTELEDVVLMSLYLAAKKLLLRVAGRWLRDLVMIRVHAARVLCHRCCRRSTRQVRDGVRRASSKRSVLAIDVQDVTGQATRSPAGQAVDVDDPFHGMPATQAAKLRCRLSGWPVAGSSRRLADVVNLNSLMSPVAVTLANGLVLLCLLAYSPADEASKARAIEFTIWATLIELALDACANTISLVAELHVLGVPALTVWHRHRGNFLKVACWASLCSALFFIGTMLRSVTTSLGIDRATVAEQVRMTCEP